MLRVSVVDGSPTPPVLRDRTGLGGHGMWLVSTIADRWGSGRQCGGKQVWFELDQ